MGDYNVSVKNRFELTFDEDVDLYDILRQQEEEKTKKEESTPHTAKPVKTQSNKLAGKNKRPGTKPTNKETNVQQSTESNRPLTAQNENRPPRMAKQTRNNRQVDDFEKPRQQDDQAGGGRGGRGNRGGFRGGRGGRGGFGGSRPGKRDFERHSGSDKTGVKSVEKREGFGSRNWGDEIEAQLQQGEKPETPPNDSNVTADSAENETENQDPEKTTEEVITEPEPKQMTLDEWKAAQASSRAKSEFKVRQAGEGVDQKQWKNEATVLNQRSRKESVESVEDDGIEDTRSTLNKLNIQITFSDNPRGRRGGRGTGRGGFGPRGDTRGGFGPRGDTRGGFGPRGDRPPRSAQGRGGFGGGNRYNKSGAASAPRVDNENEFPSLSK